MSEPRPRVLIVDDLEDNLDLLARRLERKGYAVSVASSGPDALALVDARPLELVILDVMMPGMSGLEVLERIRETRGPQELPVIMATAKGDSSDVVEALDKGANDYVVKPIDLDVLIARMRAALRAVVRAPAPPETEIVAGHQLDGKYALGERLGVGGFGTVYRATHVALRNPVAVKILHEHLLGSQQAIRRFAQEGVSACRVRHPNAVAILDAGTTWDGLPYLVMELLSGPTLQQELERERVLRLARAAEIASPLCAALDAAHREGIVHRDVKPANVMLARDATGVEVVKVLDFGIAKLLEPSPDAPATVDEIAGTPQYMAPERLLGERSDGRSDIYSVGVTLYTMLTGALPFTYQSDNVLVQALQQLRSTPRPLGVLRPDLPDDLVAAVMAALDREPQQRPSLLTLAGVVAEHAQTFEEPVWPPEVAAERSLAFDVTETGALVPRREPGSTRAERPAPRPESGTVAKRGDDGEGGDRDGGAGEANGR
ncbi:MAG: protein kinase [Sandaracinaceae bacterium]|nr:protein kinase [Sandaracinaceae bacterium]